MGVMQWYPAGKDHHGFSGNDAPIFFPESDDKLELDNYNVGFNIDLKNNSFMFLQTQFETENSALKIYRKLAKLRQRDEALIVGETVRDELINEDVILFSRYVQAVNNTATGSTFIVALNFGDKEQKIDFSIEPASKLIPSNKDLLNAEVRFNILCILCKF